MTSASGIVTIPGLPAGANSDIISIDNVLVTDTTPVELMSFAVE